MTQGYDYFTDSDTGITYAESRATGELLETTTFTVPIGSYFKTPEDQEADRKRRAGLEKALLQNEKRKTKQAALSKLGQYFFAECNDFSGLSDATVARLIFLIAYLSIDGRRLLRTARSPLNVRDLPKLMNLSEKTVRRFLGEVRDYVAVDASGSIFTTGIIFKRGTLPKGEYAMMQRFYRESIRQLYGATPKSKHHLLGIMFRSLPYINLEYNVLCKNPLENCLQDIELLSLADFCKLVGYPYMKLSRLRAEMKKLTFDVGGRKELFCSFVDAGLGAQNIQIFVNPHILYNGSDYKKVELLGKFCEQ